MRPVDWSEMARHRGFLLGGSDVKVEGMAADVVVVVAVAVTGREDGSKVCLGGFWMPVSSGLFVRALLSLSLSSPAVVVTVEPDPR